MSWEEPRVTHLWIIGDILPLHHNVHTARTLFALWRALGA